MSDELYILLMGYLDGELDDAQKARVEQALATDDALRREFEEMRRMKDLTDELGVDARTDAEIEAFWGTVYNNIERSTGWLLLLAGAFGLAGFSTWAFFTNPSTHWGVKTVAGCASIGTLILLVSVWRERRRALPHDRYTKEVHR